MITRRRLTLQITPILDMLLIVLFMQFLDIKERAAALETQASTSAASVVEMEAQVKDAQAHVAAAQQETDQVREQHEVIATMLGDVFRLTPAETQAFVKVMRAPSLNGPSPAAEAQLKALASGSPEPILQHLLTYDEIRKRCDVWELFIDEKDVAHLDTGDRVRVFRVHLDSESQDAHIDRFSEELETAYRSLPQPKHLVILQLTYDRNTLLTLTEGIADALPKVFDRMNSASGGVTRFEYADMGVRRVSPTPE